MKLKLAAALAAFSAFTAPALAATDGCPPLSFDVGTSIDGNTKSYLFGAPFEGTAGHAEPDTATIECSITPFDAAAGFSVFSADYRGFTFVPNDGQTVTLTTTGPDGQTAQQVRVGETGRDLNISQYIGTLPGQALDISIVLDLDATAGPDQMFAGVDTADIKRIGFTTLGAVEVSADGLAVQRNAVVTHLGGTANLLLGALQPLDNESHIAPIVAFGSSLIGVNGQLALGNGFSVVGGAALVSQAYGGAQLRGVLVGGALRYVSPATTPLRAFGEVGVWGSGNLGFAFDRTYQNLDRNPIITSTTEGWIASFYARAGGIYAINVRNELAIAVTVARTSLHVEGYEETMTNRNPFPIAVDDSVTNATTLKATAEWTTALTDRFDLTLMGGVGHNFGGTTLDTEVMWIGDVEGTARGTTFLEYGARVGWNLSPTATIDAFVAGTAGTGIVAHTQFGGSFRLAF